MKNARKTKREKTPLLGFIGQGWIGKHYADDFERRGFSVVRYAKEAPYDKNKKAISSCDIVFIAVPTPSTPSGFDASIVESVLKLVGRGKTAVIKSTIIPGTTKRLQKKNPGIIVLHGPEFLREASARYDTEHPDRNIVGMPKDTPVFRKKAAQVLLILPKAPLSLLCDSNEAEFVKYAGNCFLYTKVVFMNMLHDLSARFDCDWNVVRDAMTGDPRIGNSHMDPVHQNGRGAGGHCFIKDFAAFADLYEREVSDAFGAGVLRSLETKNNALLKESGKDRDLLRGVYGDDF